MGKRLNITSEIERIIKNSVDDQDLDLSNLAVFQTRILSTEPLNKKGSIFDNGRVTASTLVEMADFVNTPGTATPFITMHNQDFLSVGRVVQAEVSYLENGETALDGLFYINEDDEQGANLIKKIESASMDEVSVGLSTKKILCSECGFDYKGPEANIMNLINKTCNEGHTIGENGVHVRLVGLENFRELSLVDQGAAKNAKILSRAKQTMGKETVDRLAASGVPNDAFVLTASFKMEDNSSKSKPTKGESKMSELTELLAATSTAKGKLEAELSQSVTKIEGLNNEILSLKASIEEKDKKISELEAAQGVEVTELKASIEKKDAELKALTDSLVPHVKAALVASGEEETNIPEEASAMLKLVEEKGLKLHQLFGAGEGGKSVSSKDTTKGSGSGENLDRRKSQFKIN